MRRQIGQHVAQELRRHGEQRRLGLRDGHAEIGGGGDGRVERDAGQIDRVLVPLGDGGGDGRVARPDDRRAAGAARGQRQRRAPRAGADDARAASSRSFASGSSGQRGRTGASSGSLSPQRSRSIPAQAIIAPLSVHSAGGGATKPSPASSASAARRARSRALAATPPAATRLVPCG